MNIGFLKSLQSIRIFAALGVVQYHLWHNYLGVNIGHPGTDFFLVLVGVIAAHNQANHIPEGNWWKYISGRYKRLYVTFVPLFLLTLLTKWSEADTAWVLKSFFLIPMRGQSPVIGSTWMLSMFMLFYFVFSLCFLLRTEKILWIIGAAWLISIVMYRVWYLDPGLPAEWSNLLFSERNIHLMMGYVVGMVLRHDRLQYNQARLSAWVGLSGLIVGTMLLNVGLAAIERIILIGLPITLFILGVATLEQKNIDDPIVRFLTLPTLVWLGGTSYVLYLSHGIFFRVWSLVLPVTETMALPITLGAIVTAALGYAFWEGPVLHYIKSRSWVLPYPPVPIASPQPPSQATPQQDGIR